MHDIGLKIALIGVMGMGAQWLAWRLRLPAIVLLLIAGMVAGPATGFINPEMDFGEIYRPLVSLAVAIILFEGGLTLNFKEISETSTAVRRIILIAGPLVWVMTALSAHYVGGLTWPTAIVLGAILVVTGPTVITPLLRQAQLASRPASLLKWEAIVNDPIGALFAVVAFEVILVFLGLHQGGSLAYVVVAAFVVAVAGGFAAAKLIQWAFVRGYVPEFLKAPILLAAVLLAYALTNLVLEEAGLLTVTVMGIVLANTRIASLAEMRRFKETITVFLVSGIFILLTASLTIEDFRSLDWRAALFVASLLFVVRPLAIMIATTGSGATMPERILTSWIAPRGVVAVAVSGLFGAALEEAGIIDADRMVAFTFAVVVTTIVLHGFTLGPLASLLKLKSSEKPGLLIVGGPRWAIDLAKKLKSVEVPVMIADPNWNHIAEARLADIPVFFGDILSEEAHHTIDPKRFSNLIAVTDNDAYNSLVCTDFAPELGRSHVFQLGRGGDQPKRMSLNFTLGGRPLTKDGLEFRTLRERHWQGWTFQATRLTEAFDYNAYLESRSEDAIVLLWVKPSGAMVFASDAANTPSIDDRIISFTPAKDHLGERNGSAKKSKEKSTSTAEPE
ncbi:sodium:proton antiporter [Nitratireductor aquimarinus]|uniref:cation:proton antiporter n=1 Tax=Alphaproteobacteria TaxID=28211 RepID=UPI0019D35558|nr:MULTISPECIES: sodium:proton antiporter [Alphaproteobacteria]MBN7758120.1 sodium:proton antiporter [Nitratireductor aquimarinus]MBY6000881.1 cation:proton antiporter [Tritonibacter mobilis]MBY6022913.1 cation:proton antiporter [Nitratireductor sp. DP7N14-4]